MIKIFRAIIIIVVLILLIVGLVLTEKKVSEQATKADDYEAALEAEQDYNAVLKRRVEKLTERNAELELENSQILKRNRQLIDSVRILNTSIRKLNATIQQQAAAMTANDAMLARLRNSSDELANRIAALRQQKNVNEQLIDDLEEKRLALDRKVGEVFMKNDSLERKALASTQQLAQLTKNFDDQEEILQIIENVRVNFKTVQPLQQNKKKTKRLRKWRYTQIDFELNAPEASLIQGKVFLVKIINKQTGETLSPREGSGGNDTKGMPFTFQGNPVPTIEYPNYQNKTSKDYLVQIYFMNDGKEFPLTFGGQNIEF